MSCSARIGSSFRQGSHHAVQATHGLSLLAGLVFINSASGLYRATRGRSIAQALIRAALAITLALLFSYAVFDFLPPEIGSNEEMKWLTMLCVAGVVAHRVYAGLGSQATRPQSRILIFRAGTTAQLVARSITLANPQVKIVGFVPGPNETASIVDASQVLRGPGSLKDRAVRSGSTNRGRGERPSWRRHAHA